MRLPRNKDDFKAIAPMLLTAIVTIVIAICLMFGFIKVQNIYVNYKADKVAETNDVKVSKVDAYQFGGPNSSDIVRLKDKTQFEKINFIIGRNNFATKVPFNAKHFKEGAKVTYVQNKDGFLGKGKYYILEVE